MSSRRARSTRVRTKVVALLLSLVALWFFAAFVTVRDGLNLLFVSTLDQGIAQPNELLLPSLQDERRLTLAYLGNSTSAARQAMLDQRAVTDRYAADFIAAANSNSVKLAATSLLKARLADMFALLDGLPAKRTSIDAGRMSRIEAADVFSNVGDSIFACLDAISAVDNEGIAKDARTLIKLTRAREVLAREDALLVGALSAGQITAAEHIAFVQLVGAQRFLYSEAIADLPGEDQARFDELFRRPAVVNFRALENNVVEAGPTSRPIVSVSSWESAIRPLFDGSQEATLASGDALVGRAVPVAVGVVIRLALAGVLGLIAVIASIVISIITARRLVRQLGRLRNAANDLASYRLPRVVERLQHGERVDVETEAPPLDFGRDEIGQVGEAFNQVQETAVRVAVEQAELRRSVRDVFLSLARRSQALLHRQLGLLDAMERRSTDSEELAELFRIDHLATRMRRNAENLIVLSGATAGRAWRKPVPIVDVLRGALAEVEDYTRVTVLPVGPASLLGRAVGDVIHLLAELIENAVSFSPPQTVVRVGGSVVGYGFAIEIEDRGLGMSAEELEAANEQLRNPPEFRLTSTARLGLYVVGKLAERHGIRVRLTDSPYGGTTAIVLLPGTLIADGDDDRNRDSSEDEQLATVGRHRLRSEALAPADSSGRMAPGIPAGTQLADRQPAALTGYAAPADVGISKPISTVAGGPVANGTVASGAVGTPNGANGPNGVTVGEAVDVTRPTTEPRPAPASAPPASAPPASAPPASAPPASAPPASAPPASAPPASAPPASAPLAAAPAAAASSGTVSAAGASPVAPSEARSAPATGFEAVPTPRRSADAPILTPSGLPWRHRPARTGPGAQPPAPSATGGTGETRNEATQRLPADGEPPTGNRYGSTTGAASERDPDQTRSLMASYRSGTLRGRTDAARLTRQDRQSPEWTESATEPRATEKEG